MVSWVAARRVRHSGQNALQTKGLGGCACISDKQCSTDRGVDMPACYSGEGEDMQEVLKTALLLVGMYYNPQAENVKDRP
jgi:hypothetical protein